MSVIPFSHKEEHLRSPLALARRAQKRRITRILQKRRIERIKRRRARHGKKR